MFGDADRVTRDQFKELSNDYFETNSEQLDSMVLLGGGHS